MPGPEHLTRQMRLSVFLYSIGRLILELFVLDVFTVETPLSGVLRFIPIREHSVLFDLIL
jgi:hypothetical protein